jgi:hypothetical protein
MAKSQGSKVAISGSRLSQPGVGCQRIRVMLELIGGVYGILETLSASQQVPRMVRTSLRGCERTIASMRVNFGNRI